MRAVKGVLPVSARCHQCGVSSCQARGETVWVQEKVVGQVPDLNTEIPEQACISSRTTTNEMGGPSRQPKGQPEMRGDGEPDAVTMCQLKSVSQFSMKIQVGDQTVEAIVDTAAQVTIISDRLCNWLRGKPQKSREVKLLTAGRQMSMKGFVVGPVRLKIGEKRYR